jgi:NADPH:quinone reductase-like Zn-dependent oxidoreductase
VFFADRHGVVDALVGMLERAGHTCIRVVSGTDYLVLSPTQVQIDPLDAAHVERVCREHLAQPCAGVVYGWMLDVPLPAPTADGEPPIDVVQRRKCGTALVLLQQLAALDPARRTALHVLTRGAQAVAEGEHVNPAQATVWGLARVAALEHPDLRVVCVDLDPAAGLDDRHVLRATISAGGAEREIAIRGGQRYLRRIRRLDTRAAAAAAGPVPVRVEIPTRGVLDDLRLDPIEPREPGAGEIAIEVRAAGLNFRDVLNALGTYPGDAGAFGSECAGVVTAVGQGVTAFAPGDAVIALADASMASHVVTPAVRAVAKPAPMSFDAAATLPIAFLTAEYALHDLAQLTPGDRVLIHAAAGGVGLAAVQLAQRAGATVYATAGSPEKHRFLRALGVEHVLSSRSLDFADRLMALTDGQGVDVALNSLAGQFIPRTLATLAPGGRFVEIGKTDIWDRTRVRTIRPDVQYHTLYLGEIIESRPDRTAQMLADVVASCVRGELKPLPVRAFALDDAASAFRYMAQARHIGKVVLTPARRPGAGLQADVPVGPQGTYLITGGLGSLGLHVARWLVALGARHLVLIGRRDPGEAAATAVRELEQAGVQIVIEQADIAEADALDAVLARLDASMSPLRGVVHAAGVLDDGVIAQQQWPRFAAVMRPKVDGAWNLHRATFDRPLDFFVLFSAAASAFGSAGQANYACANTFLDTLAHLRRAHDLPALSVSWGAWAEGGMISALATRDRQRLAEQGLGAMAPADALAALAELIAQPRATAIVADMDWDRYRGWVSQLPPWLTAVTAERRVKATPADADPTLLALLADAPPARRLSLLVAHVHQQALRVLGLPPTYPLDAYQGLRDVGLDSLMAIELRNHLQRSVERDLPTTLAFDYPTVDAIARHVMSVLSATARPQSAPQDAVEPVADDVDALTDAEAAALLNAELAGLQSSEGPHE